MKDFIRITSPTGLGERNDSEGFGYYGAPRGKRIHLGRDYEGVPGQDVYCPIESGKIVREAPPYEFSKFKGILIQGKHIAVKMFYLDPWEHLIGKYVKRYDIIGIMQDISERYNGMTPHVHLKIDSIDPELLQ
jgi:hypothetical protein